MYDNNGVKLIAGRLESEEREEEQKRTRRDGEK